MFNKKHNQLLAQELATRSLAQVIFETSILVVIALAAVVGNSLVLYVFYKTPNFRKVANYYLITLAISDVVFSLTEMPIAIAVAATGRQLFGRNIGEISGIFGMAFLYGSFLTTVLIAVNRFFCVVKPNVYKKYFKPKPALIMIAVVWIISFGVVIVPFLEGTVEFQFYPGRLHYYPAFTNLEQERIVTAITHLGFCFFPALVAACYWKIYKAVKGHNATVSTTLNAGPRGAARPSKEEINITRTVLPLACGSILFWFSTSTVIQLDVYINLPRWTDMFLLYLVFLNSAINPFIFNTFNKPFRKQFFKLFGCGLIRVKKAKVGNTVQIGLNLSSGVAH